MTGRQDLLNQSVREIQNALSGNGKLKINQKIRLKVRSLTEDFGLERDEIENVAVEEFLSRELYEKCNPEKTLSTFCTHFASYSLNGQLRKEKRHRKHHQTVSLDGLAQDTHDNDWAYSDEFLEPAGDESLADHITPEDFLHAKELLDLIIKHFGYDDAAVALGCKSRQAEAKRLEYHSRRLLQAPSTKDRLLQDSVEGSRLPLISRIRTPDAQPPSSEGADRP